MIAWEIVYFGFWPDFMDQFQGFQLAKMRAEGASAAAVAEMQAEMARFAELYRNPFFNVAITFLEVFPVGLIVTLVSALILRRGPRAGAAARAAA